jgi:Skp family chaperone for outer membrane proteins
MVQHSRDFGRVARRVAAALFLAGLLAAPAAAAQQKPQQLPVETDKLYPVIGVVDVQEVLRDSVAAKGVRTAAEARAKKLEAELNKEREDLKGREQQLRQQQTILAPDAFDKKRQELERYVAELRRKHEGQRVQMNQVFNEAMDQLREEIRKSVVMVMEKRGIAMTLPRSAVLVFDERMNITKEVTETVNKRAPKIAVNFDAPPKPATKKQ